MKRPTIAPQTFAALGALAVLAGVAIVSAPPEPPPVSSYASDDFAAGGYRAWSDLLAREGLVPGRFVLRPVELDDGIDTLISAQPARALPLTSEDARTAADIGALATWVRHGGRLIYLGRNVAVAAAETRQLELPRVLPAAGRRGGLTGGDARLVRSLRGLGNDRMRRVQHVGTALLSDRNGAIVVRYPLGRGEVVAVVDPQLFTNANLAGADNARLAFLLGRPRRAGGRSAFDDGLHGALLERPWYRALSLPVRVGLSIAGLALGLGLVGSGLRGSAPMSLRSTREPSSAEFIDALAALYERTNARSAVRSMLARDALATAARSAGLPDDVAPPVLLARLAGRSSEGALRRLLDLGNAPVVTDADLLASAQLAYLVRKESGDGGTGNRGRAAFASGARPSRRR